MRSATTAPNFDALADSALIRAGHLVRSGRNPDAPLPFSISTLHRKVREGSFPAPLKLGAATTAWRVGDVRRWVNKRGAA